MTACHPVLRLGMSAAYMYFATCLHGTSLGNCGTVMEDCLTSFGVFAAKAYMHLFA